MVSVEETSSMLDSYQSHKPVQKGFSFTIVVRYLDNQNLGIWCMKPHDTKHPEISGAPFPLALYDGGLYVILKNPRMRDRIKWFIDASTDVFLTEVCYYHKCWLKSIAHRAPTAEKIIHLQNTKIWEAQEMVFHHVQEMIFRDHEIRTLTSINSA